VVFDLYMECNLDNFEDLLVWLKDRGIKLVSVDGLIEYCNKLDLVWMPSFDFDLSRHKDCTCLLYSGWSSFLIQKKFDIREWSPGNKILILTGGGDTAKLGETIPAKLDNLLDIGMELHWVKGPFAGFPKLPKKRRLNWIIHDAPLGLDELIVKSNYVMTVFGVSFFEVLQYGIPTVVFSPYGAKDNDELVALSKEGVALVSSSAQSAISNLISLINDEKAARECSVNALQAMSVNGVQKFCKKIYFLIESKSNETNRIYSLSP